MNANELSRHLTDGFKTMETVDGSNSFCFTVRGWPFAIIRNGWNHWDVLTPNGLETAHPTDQLHDLIQAAVIECEADNAGWDFDPEEIAT